MSTRARSANGSRRSNSNGGPTIRPSSRQSAGNGNGNERKVVGQYLLGKTIGEGTFGKVKLAIHLPTGEKVPSYMLSHSF